MVVSAGLAASAVVVPVLAVSVLVHAVAVALQATASGLFSVVVEGSVSVVCAVGVGDVVAVDANTAEAASNVADILVAPELAQLVRASRHSPCNRTRSSS